MSALVGARPDVKLRGELVAAVQNQAAVETRRHGPDVGSQPGPRPVRLADVQRLQTGSKHASSDRGSSASGSVSKIKRMRIGRRWTTLSDADRSQ